MAKLTERAKRNLAYKKTRNGLVGVIYGNQRLKSRRAGWELPDYSATELREWMFLQDNFNGLYNNWVESGYDRNLSPSCDRTDDYQGYCLTRLELMTWAENREKGHRDRVDGVNNKMSKSVVQMTLNSDFVAEYYSHSKASKETGIARSMITNCCLRNQKTAGGFRWMASING